MDEAATASLAVDKLGSIHIGKIASSDLSEKKWLGEEATVQIRSVEVSRPTISVSINNSTYNLGVPDKATSEIIDKYLTEKQMNLLIFNAKSVKFGGEGYSTFIDLYQFAF